VVWVANVADRTLTRIDAETRSIIGTVPLTASPDGLAVAFDAVWVVNGRMGLLFRIDPAFPRDVQTFPIGSRARRYARGALAPGAGSLWAAFGDASLARVDPRSPSRSSSTYAGPGPAAVVVADGYVWVANFAGSNVQRFNPLTFDEAPIETLPVGKGPSGLAAGSESVWVANAGDDNVARIDPTVTSNSSVVTIPVGDAPGAVAYGEDAVWVANRGAGTVSRIDPETNDVSDEIPVGGAPSGIAVVGDEVWVTVQVR
jgi:YVTN family beta-propeller protein